MLGETLPSITKDMDTYTYRLPIGVCAGIAPFNFPAMIPLWMFPMGMVCGNTYLMKPSERVPGCTMLLAKLLQDAGAPDGTLNIIHGQHDGMENYRSRRVINILTTLWSRFCVQITKWFFSICYYSCELHLWPSCHQSHQFCRLQPGWRAHLWERLQKWQKSAEQHGWFWTWS